MKRLTGTREWAFHNVTIVSGCSGGCRYCYGREMALRFGRIKTPDEWNTPCVKTVEVAKRRRKFDGIVMFQGASDITPANISECLVVIKKLLAAGNEVLIVSKPHLECMQLLCEVLRPWKRHVMFRFTIGSLRDNVLKFWEPGAPGFENRFKSLSCAYFEDYRTSVSCEPFLDVHPAHIQMLFEECRPYLSDDPAGGFWIGKLRRWSSRVDLSGATEEEIKLYVEPLRAAQGDAFVRELVRRLDGRRFIRWKDSIREVIEKEPQINADERREITTEKGS